MHRRDELHEVLHANIIELMDSGGADAESIADWVCAERPDLEANCGRATILSRAEELLVSEIPELSAAYQRIFEEFNSRYFGAGLRAHTVRVVYAMDFGGPTEDGGYAEPSAGIIDLPGRIIRLRLSGSQELMEATLLHEMAHGAVGNGDHGPDWLREMRRLDGLGAPVLPCDLEEESMLKEFRESLKREGPKTRPTMTAGRGTSANSMIEGPGLRSAWSQFRARI